MSSLAEKINSILLKKRKMVRIVENDLPVQVELLQLRLGYHFKDLSLLIHALMHKSAITPEHDPMGLSSNERLELLGDSILDFLVIEELFTRRPQLTEGQITSIKSLVVSRKIIGEVAAKIDLHTALILGKCYENQRHLRTTQTDVASNAFEALIAAIYLDGGMESVRSILRDLLFPFIEQLVMEKENINYKSIILEYLQGKGLAPAKYTILNESGPDHKKEFRVGIEIDGKILGEAIGSNKKDAEQRAAKIAASKLRLV